MTPGKNSFGTLAELTVGDRKYRYYSLDKLARETPAIEKLPYSLKVLLENILRFEQGDEDSAGDIAAFEEWVENRASRRES